MAPETSRRGRTGRFRGASGSGLVEEALLDELRALLRRDLDVARREHEDLVGDPLHAAVERVGQAAGEVDEALGEVVSRWPGG